MLHLAVSLQLPPRLTDLGGLFVPARFYQRLHLLEDRFGERAREVLSLLPNLDLNEDAEDVLPEAPAVVVLLDVPDPVLRLPAVAAIIDLEDYVGVVLPGALHLAEDDAPYANLGSLFLDRADPSLRCYSLSRVEKARVARLDQGPHTIPRARVEDGAPLDEKLPNQRVPRFPKADLRLPGLGVFATAWHLRPIYDERRRRFVRALQHMVRNPRRSQPHGFLGLFSKQEGEVPPIRGSCCSLETLLKS